MKNRVLIGVVIIIFSCQNSNKEEQAKISINQNKTSADTLPQNKEDTNKLSLFEPFQKKAKIEILTLRKTFDSSSLFLKKYGDRCIQWNLSKQDISNIFSESKNMDGHEFHHYYDVLPCYFEGEARLENKLINYQINAGAFMILSFQDTTLYFGYEGGKYNFLSHPGID